jgi:hypothetical protein
MRIDEKPVNYVCSEFWVISCIVYILVQCAVQYEECEFRGLVLSDDGGFRNDMSLQLYLPISHT